MPAKSKKGQKKADDQTQHPDLSGQWNLGVDAAATAHDLLATASSLYARMSADHPGSLPDDDAYWSSLPAHLRQFIRNALPLGQLQSNNHHTPPKMSAAAMQAVAQQIASATRYPPNNNSSQIQGVPHGPAPPPASSFDFSDPSVRFALEQLGPPPSRGLRQEDFDQEYYTDEEVDSIDGTDGDYNYHSGVIYDSGVIPLTTPGVQSDQHLNGVADPPSKKKKRKNKKSKPAAQAKLNSKSTTNAIPPPPPPPAQPVPPPPVSQPPPPSSRAAGKAPMSYLPQQSNIRSNGATNQTKSKSSQTSSTNKQTPSSSLAKKIWSTNSTEERERIKEFWLSLSQDERRKLVQLEKETVLKKMKEQQKHSCSCAVCGRKRSAIEDELEVLYDAYYDELEQYVAHQHQHYSSPNTIPPPPGPGPFPGSVELDKNGQLVQPPDSPDDDDDLDDEYDDEDDEDYDDDDPEDDLSGDEDYEDDQDSLSNTRRYRHNNRRKKPEIFTSSFSKTFTVQEALGGILTVADDLLKNDGQKFLEMMESLAERRLQREEEAAAGFDDSEEEDEQDEDEEDDDDLEDEDEEDRMEDGRRMFQVFAARMFEQRVLQAYREKVAQERQLQLLRELEEEDKVAADKEAKKAKENQRKKDKKRLQRQQKEEADAAKKAHLAEEEAAKKAKQEAAQEAARRRQEAERQRREAERQAKEEEKRRREAERQRQQEIHKEREAEKDRKKKEREDKLKAEKDEQERAKAAKLERKKERAAAYEAEQKAIAERAQEEEVQKQAQAQAQAQAQFQAQAQAQAQVQVQQARMEQIRQQQAQAQAQAAAQAQRTQFQRPFQNPETSTSSPSPTATSVPGLLPLRSPPLTSAAPPYLMRGNQTPNKDKQVQDAPKAPQALLNGSTPRPPFYQQQQQQVQSPVDIRQQGPRMAVPPPGLIPNGAQNAQTPFGNYGLAKSPPSMTRSAFESNSMDDGFFGGKMQSQSPIGSLTGGVGGLNLGEDSLLAGPSATTSTSARPVGFGVVGRTPLVAPTPISRPSVNTTPDQASSAPTVGKLLGSSALGGGDDEVVERPARRQSSQMAPVGLGGSPWQPLPLSLDKPSPWPSATANSNSMASHGRSNSIWGDNGTSGWPNMFSGSTFLPPSHSTSTNNPGS